MAEPTIGHNKPPLEDIIFAQAEDGTVLDVKDVLAAVATYLTKQAAEDVDRVTARTKVYAGNAERIPEKLDSAGVAIALDLLAAAEQHADEATTLRDSLIAEVKAIQAALTKTCKPLDAGLDAIDKKLRPLFIAYLLEKLDAHNAERTEDEAKMTSITERGPSGAKATLTDGYENVVTDQGLVPRDLCVPDQALIDAAIAEGKTVPGVARQRKPTLRVYK